MRNLRDDFSETRCLYRPVSKRIYTKETFTMNRIEGFNAFIKKLNIYQPSPVIYDSIAGFSEFGPYGATIKSSLINRLKKEFRKAAFWEVEHPIIMPKKVWEASGHVERFLDIIAESETKIFRVDKVVEEEYPHLLLLDRSIEGIRKFLQENKIVPKGHKEPLSNPREYWLMMMTSVAGEEATLRPETATATYSSFKEYYALFRNSMPIKIFQHGKVFRNEITTRQGLIRGREFEQIEGQIFVLQENKNEFNLNANKVSHRIALMSSDSQINKTDAISMSIADTVSSNVLTSTGYAYCFSVVMDILNGIGLGDCELRFRQHLPDEKAHYALDAWDVELKTEQYGWLEICGIHDRGDYDLTRHQEYSRKKLSVNNGEQKQEIPNILEIAFGVGRLMYCLLENGFHIRDEKNILSLPYYLCPIQVAVFPLVKKDGLSEIAEEINFDLNEAGFISVYDEKGSIGKRYARMDEIGTPFCLTIDHDTLTDNSVTIRDRDTCEQRRIDISKIQSELRLLNLG